MGRTLRLSRTSARVGVLLGFVSLMALLPTCTSGGAPAIVGHSPWQLLGTMPLSSFAFSDEVRGWGADFSSTGLMTSSDGGHDWGPCTGRIVGRPVAERLPATVDRLALPVQVVRAGEAVFVAYDDRLPLGGSLGSMPRAARSGILASADGGMTWRPCLSLTDPREVVLFVAASDARHLWALCRSIPAGETAGSIDTPAFLLRTSDGGRHWVRLGTRQIGDPALPGVLGVPLVFVDPEHGWSLWDSSPAPLLRVTADGGRTWTLAAQVQNVGLGFSALDAGHAWIATGTTRQAVGGLFATSDGGRSWTRSGRFTRIPLAAVYFANARDGWVVAAGSTGAAATRGVYATSDGGRHWRRELTPASSDQAWGRPGWQFCRAGTTLVVGCEGEMFSRPLPASAL
jgi:photosystem II stability/assembly factor-like uncharacterized protein